MAIIIFFSLLLFLFSLSQVLSRSVSACIYALTKSKKVTISVLSLLFLPGTVLHELAHFCMALILFVPVGSIEFLPELRGDTVKLGSVGIGKVDIFRRLLVGGAPFLFGTLLLLSVLFFYLHHEKTLLITLLIGYITFEIGNTMFASRKDMEGALELFIALFVLTFIAFLLGVRLPPHLIQFVQDESIISIFTQGCYFLLFPIALDLCVIILLKFFEKYSLVS